MKVDTHVEAAASLLVGLTFFPAIVLHLAVFAFSVRTDLHFRHLRATGVFPSDTPDFAASGLERSWSNIQCDQFYGRDDLMDRQLRFLKRLSSWGVTLAFFAGLALVLLGLAAWQESWRFAVVVVMLGGFQATTVFVARRLHLRLLHRVQTGDLPADTPLYGGCVIVAYGGEIFDQRFDAITDQEIVDLIWLLRAIYRSMWWIVAAIFVFTIGGHILAQ